MTRPVYLLLVLALSLVLFGCDDPDPQPASTPTTLEAPQHESKGAWSYSGEAGPENWVALSSDYKACNGSQQSPINLADASPPDEGALLKTSYTTEEVKIVDAGHAVTGNTTGGTLTIRGKSYDLQQFSAHTPSEHTVEGERYAAEIHLVHQAGDQRAVLALLVEEGSAHDHLDDWIQSTDTTLARYNVGRLLPSRRSYYSYEGSLTTPPCTEGVRWVVMNTPIQASPEQLEMLRAQHDDNARPLQPRNDRRVVLVAP